MNLQKKLNLHKEIILILEQNIEYEKNIEELLIKVEKAEPVLIKDVPDYRFKGADILRDLAMYRNRISADKQRVFRLEAKAHEYWFND